MDDVIDELATLAFNLNASGLPARAITARMTNEILTWAVAKGWSARTEARVEFRATDGRLRDYGFIDLIVHRGPGEADVAIEIDQTDKPRSVAKLQYAMALGMEAVWIRWRGADWTNVDGIHVIHMPETEGHPARRRAAPQLTLW